ncbi:MAG: FtsX-like permease family protein, partial [Vicinamibacterales bacterium]
PTVNARPEFFLPIQQAPQDAWTWIGRTMTIVARSRTGDAPALAADVRGAVRRIDPTLPLYEARTMEQRLQRSVAQERFNTQLMLMLGAIGLVLAAVGIYGVLAYVVAQRQHEIGIRMALGAKGRDVIRMVVRQGMRPVGLGVALGLAGTYAAAPALSPYVYGVKSTDPATFAAVAVLVVAVALLASLVPAWRVVRVDPARVLTST